MGREAYERSRIGFVALAVDDLAAQRDAMVNGLGLEVRFEDENLVVFAMEGTDLVLERARPGREAGTRFGFYSLNLDAETDAARAGGLEVLTDCENRGDAQRASVFRLLGG